MMELKVGKKNYKVKFGYNSFCDTDLMDRVNELMQLFNEEAVENDSDVAGLKKIKDLFLCVRELIFVGCKKYNPIESVQEVGDLLDEYKETETEDDKHGLFDLFTALSEELLSEGFLADILQNVEVTENEKVAKIPQDHKKKVK